MALEQETFDPIDNAKSQILTQNRGWSQKSRESALSRLSNIGLPNHRDEYWKYTNPAELLTNDLHGLSVANHEEANVFAEVDALKIVFCDGIYRPDLSDEFLSDNMSINRLADEGCLLYTSDAADE